MKPEFEAVANAIEWKFQCDRSTAYRLIYKADYRFWQAGFSNLYHWVLRGWVLRDGDRLLLNLPW